MTKFSIIVPVYKVPYLLLRNSIKSVINQTYQDFEVILIDDGSPDGCGNICDEYAQKDSRIRVIHQKNSGLSVVRNVGVEAAQGEWVSFVDGDDWIEKDTYKKAAELIEKYGDQNDVIAWDGYADFSEDNIKPINFFGGVSQLEMKSLQERMDSVMPEYHKTGFRLALFDVTWARVYRRSTLVQNNITNVPGLRRAQDLIFNLEVFEYAKGIYYENLPLYHYSMHEEAATKTYDVNITEKMEQFSLALKKFVTNFHHNDNEYYQRMYVKIMPKIVECFGQYYVPLWKREGMMHALNILKIELEIPIFREAVEKMDGSKNNLKMKVFQFLLEHRYYILLMIICRLQTERKAKWMSKQRKDKNHF